MYEKFKIYGVTNRCDFKTSRRWYVGQRDLSSTRHQPADIFIWKKKYSGMDATNLKRLKELEAENSRLKRMFADVSLQRDALKDLIEKKL